MQSQAHICMSTPKPKPEYLHVVLSLGLQTTSEKHPLPSSLELVGPLLCQPFLNHPFCFSVKMPCVDVGV